MNKKVFENIGLNKNEALAYKSLIEYGELTPPKVAELTGLSRENAYFILKELERKELIEKTEKKKKLTYKILHPKKIKDYLELQKKELEEKINSVEEIIPEIEQHYLLSSEKTSVSFFKGIKGIKTVYEDIFKKEKPKEMLVFRTRNDAVLGNYYIRQDMVKLTKMGVKGRLIASDNEKLFEKVDKTVIDREVKYLDSKYFDIPSEIAIYNNRVTISSFKKEKAGIIIENAEIAETFRRIFNYIWDKNK